MGYFPHLANAQEGLEVALQNQKLTHVPEVLLHFPYAAEIDLSGNFITEIPDALFALPQLTTLNLENNHLGALPTSVHTMRSFSHFLTNDGMNELREFATTLYPDGEAKEKYAEQMKHHLEEEPIGIYISVDAKRWRVDDETHLCPRKPALKPSEHRDE